MNNLAPTTNIYLLAQSSLIDNQPIKQMLLADTQSTVFVEQVDSLIAAHKSLAEHNYQALILNLGLPKAQDLRHIRRLLSSYPDIPLVVLSDGDDPELAMKCLRLGVQDFVSKDQLNAEVLNRIIRYSIQRKQISAKQKRALMQADKKNTQLAELARTDSLTQLPNRAYLLEVAKKAIGMANRMGHCFGVIYFDMNGFKAVNDNFGHGTGDKILTTIADRLMKGLRNGDTVARVGGDEFVVLTGKLEDPIQAHAVADKISEIIAQLIVINGDEFNMTASIGIATYPEVDTVEKLIQCADLAMYESKASGENAVCFYTKQLEQKYRDQRLMEHSLKSDLLNSGLDAVFQPIFHGLTNSLSAECLCRWSNNTLGQVSPAKFIPIADTAKLGDQLTSHILHQASGFIDLCTSHGLKLDKMCINILGRQFIDNHFAWKFLDQLNALNLSPNLICLEINENQIPEHLDAYQIQIETLKKHGVRIALDNFGTGISSITHLIALPIDYLKLDRSLISFIDRNEKYQALCDGIIHMSHRMGVSVVAEGIERTEEYDMLKALGCDEFQGHLMGSPMKDLDLIDHWHKCISLEPKLDLVNR